MRNSFAPIRVSLLALALATPLTAPLLAHAQERPGQTSATSAMRQISVELQDADLRRALQQIFNAAKVSYTVDPSVKGTVTATFSDTPLHTVLEIVLKNAPMPLTYRFENGVYSVLPKESEEVEASEPRLLMVKLHPNNTPAATMVQRLKAMPSFGPNSGITYQVNSGDNSILITTRDESQYRDLKVAVALLDVPTREVSVRAEVVLMTGKGDKTNKSVVSMLGRTASEGTIKLQMTNGGGKPNPDAPLVVSAGDYHVTLKPTVNGDGSIQVEAEVNLDITYRLPGDSSFQHLRTKLAGSGRYLSGDTMVFSSTVLKSQEGNAQKNDAEMLIFFTPTLVQPRVSQRGTPGGVPPQNNVQKAADKRGTMHPTSNRNE